MSRWNAFSRAWLTPVTSFEILIGSLSRFTYVVIGHVGFTTLNQKALFTTKNQVTVESITMSHNLNIILKSFSSPQIYYAFDYLLYYSKRFCLA